MLALGGDAKMTKRATSEHEKRGKINVGSFIRYGCNKAEIRVRLSNMTDDEGLAYRSEVYGAAIVMERQIYKSPQEVVTSRHIVRNCAGKIVYEQSELRCKHIDIFDNSYVVRMPSVASDARPTRGPLGFGRWQRYGRIR